MIGIRFFEAAKIKGMDAYFSYGDNHGLGHEYAEEATRTEAEVSRVLTEDLQRLLCRPGSIEVVGAQNFGS